MKLSKLLLAVLVATALLAALVTSASANRLEISSLTNKATWTRMNFRGGFGTVECEVVVSGSFHSRSITKTVQLIGYVTEASIIRCARGGGTINRASLPWHREYKSFSGTLPNIISFEGTVTGVEWNIREPTFGFTCTVSRTNSSTIGTYALTSGVVTRASVSGSSPCGSFTGTLEGSTERIENGSGARLTVTLI